MFPGSSTDSHHRSFGATGLGAEASNLLHRGFLPGSRQQQYTTDAKSLEEIVNGFDSPAESARKLEAYCRQETALGRAGTSKLNSELLAYLPQIMLCLSRWLRAESSTVDSIILGVFDPKGPLLELVAAQSGVPGPSGRVVYGGNLRYLLPISVLPTATQRELLIQTGEQFDAAHATSQRSFYALGGGSAGRRAKPRDALCEFLSLPDRYQSDSRSIQLTAEEYFLFCFVYLMISGPISAMDVAAGRSQHSYSGRKDFWSSHELGIGSSKRRCPSDTGEAFSDAYDRLLDLYLARYFDQTPMTSGESDSTSPGEKQHRRRMGLLLVHLVTPFWISPQLSGPVGVAQMKLDVPLLRSLRTVCIRVLALDSLRASITAIDAEEARGSTAFGGMSDQEWTLLSGDRDGSRSPLPPSFPPECQVLLPSIVELLHLKLCKDKSAASSSVSSETAVYLIKIWIMLLQPWGAGSWLGSPSVADADVWPYYVTAMQRLLRNPVNMEALPLYYPLMEVVFTHPAVSGTCEDMLMEGEDDRKFFNSSEIYSFVHMLVVLFECVVNDRLMSEIAINSLPPQGGGNAVFTTPSTLAKTFVEDVNPVYRALLRSASFLSDFKHDIKRIADAMKVSSFWGRTILVTGQSRPPDTAGRASQRARGPPQGSKLGRLRCVVEHAFFHGESSGPQPLPTLQTTTPPNRIYSPPPGREEAAPEPPAIPPSKRGDASYNRPLRYRGSRWSRPVASIEFGFLMDPCKNLARSIGRVLRLDPVVTSSGQTEPYVEWTRSLCSARVLFWLMISLWMVISNAASESFIVWVGSGTVYLRCLWMILLLIVAHRYWTAP